MGRTIRVTLAPGLRLFRFNGSMARSAGSCKISTPFGFALAALMFALLATESSVWADAALLKSHCGKCHNDEDLEGDFSLTSLASQPGKENAKLWLNCLEFVRSKDMPPEDESRLSDAEREQLIAFLDQKVRAYATQASDSLRVPPRRLNNREFENSVRDVLRIEDVGTHHPTANLLGDTLHHGFDTHGETLGFSRFHLEQYIEAYRKILDATVLTGEQPKTKQYEISSRRMRLRNPRQRRREGRIPNDKDYLDFLDPKAYAYFVDFETAPETGWYRFTIRATGKDRGVYQEEATGIYHEDPIRLNVHLGDRVRTFELPDEKVMEIELEEWVAAGTRIEFSHPTDGLTLIGNGNFKFQYRIAHDHIKRTDATRYASVVKQIKNRSQRRKLGPSHWSHWTNEWEGPRPRLLSASIKGPFYKSWPPERQLRLLGENPTVANAAAILRPIATRAWRRTVAVDELTPIVEMVRSRAEELGEIGALKEGIVAVLVSPAALLLNPEDGESAERFATKFSFFLRSTIPTAGLRKASKAGRLDSFDAVRRVVGEAFSRSIADEFLREFPHAWLELDQINFMAPDPDRYELYHRKRLSEDMIAEVRAFFRHAVENNLPIPELLSADYSFINADLAKVYGVRNVPQNSQLSKYTFKDGRRGGLLGMGAFLTSTADSLSTSPIHRAVFVMENFLGIHPTPPPADVEITEPDVRQAKTIKEILAAHTEDSSCASCHKSIDPYGYAFESFDPMGSWRTFYASEAERPSRKKIAEIVNRNKDRAAQGLPLIEMPWEGKPIAIDSSAKFRNGFQYQDITQFRKYMQADINRDRFVRCFITKLLTYANGVEPDNYAEVESILEQSAANEYRIVDTIAAVIHSPLFREK